MSTSSAHGSHGTPRAPPPVHARRTSQPDMPVRQAAGPSFNIGKVDTIRSLTGKQLIILLNIPTRSGDYM